MGSSLQSKIARAVRAHLISEGVGTAADVFCEMSTADRTLPSTTIVTGDGQEYPFATGNWRFTVSIVLRDTAVQDPDETNTNVSWTDANTRYSAIRDALTQIGGSQPLLYTAQTITTAGQALATSDGSDEGDLRAEDNADMAAFTCMWWKEIGLSAPTASETGTHWESELQFDCMACNSALS